MSYWNILIALSVAELVLAGLFFAWTARIGVKPVGMRLMAIGLVFLAQSIISLMAYYNWKTLRYGPQVAKPLLLYHLLTITGLAILLDIVRK